MNSSVLQNGDVSFSSVVEKKNKLNTTNNPPIPLLHASSFCKSIGGNIVLSCGSNDAGQLGYDRPRCTKPRRIDDVSTLLGDHDKIADVSAGAMHSVVLTEQGKIFSWGCQDDGALGRILGIRDSGDDDDSGVPKEVEMPKECSTSKVISVTAGDCHTAFLLDDGSVWACGSFQDESSRKFLTEKLKSSCTPVPVYHPKGPPDVVVKISSGCHHLAMLLANGNVFTTGVGGVGQLGQFFVSSWERSRQRKEGEPLPCPMRPPGAIRIARKRNGARRFDNVWTTAYSTFVRDAEHNHDIYAFGLNNYHQLGIDVSEPENNYSFPLLADKFNSGSENDRVGPLIRSIVGEHHSLALLDNGTMLAIGRGDDGRLGIGQDINVVDDLNPISLPDSERAATLAANTAFALCSTDNGSLYGWGYNSEAQLGLGAPDGDNMAVLSPEKGTSNHLTDHKVVAVSTGGQHSLIAAAEV